MIWGILGLGLSLEFLFNYCVSEPNVCDVCIDFWLSVTYVSATEHLDYFLKGVWLGVLRYIFICECAWSLIGHPSIIALFKIFF